MSYNFKNIVFEGGGIKAIAYIGALQILEKEGILKNIKRVGGSSAGAIIALLVGLNYTANEIKKELDSLNLKDFLDKDKGIIRNTYRLFFNGYGWFKGDTFMTWIEKIIYQKTKNKNSTFKDIKNNPQFKDMFFQGTNLSTHFIETFSADESKYEDMPIKNAVRISMSIPLFFKCIKKNKCVYVDSGIVYNYPVRLFDSKKYVTTLSHYSIPKHYRIIPTDNKMQYVYNKETLGFRLVNNEQFNVFTNSTSPKTNTINSFFKYTRHLISTIMESQQNTPLNQHDSDRTIYIDSFNVSVVDFSIDNNTKNTLINSGRSCTNLYLNKYIDNQNYTIKTSQNPTLNNIII